MQKRQYSNNKLPKIPSGDSTLSSKLYSLTGLRIFQAKFMEELRYPHPQQKIANSSIQNNQNYNSIIKLSNNGNIKQTFSGKERTNQFKQDANRESEKQKQATKKDITKQIEKPRLKNCRPKGFKNIGNTCYINAVLQSLLALEVFNCAIQNQLAQRKIEKGISVVYKQMFTSFRTCNNKEIFNPSELKNIISKKKPRFAGNSQQDSQEFLTGFLQSLHQQMARVKIKPKYKQLHGDTSKNSIINIAEDWWNYFKERQDSVICDYFQGQLQTRIICLNCSFKTVSFDNFWGLPLSFNRKGGTNLHDMLISNFNTQSRLDDYNCEKCKSQKCKKTNKVFRLPTLLTIQLKRFGFGNNRKQKIKERVCIPLELCLKQVMSEQTKQKKTQYHLKSIVQHSGDINFGHYTAQVYSQKQQTWYRVDDDYVVESDVDLNLPQIYLLFYQMK